MIITVGSYSKSIEESLSMVLSDVHDGVMQEVWHGDEWMDVNTMDGPFEDDMDMYFTPFASEKDEGGPMALGTFKEGRIKRYRPTSYAIQMIVTHEAQSDRRGPAVIDLGKAMKLAMYRTKELLGVQVLARALDTNHVGLDGVPLASAAHTLVGGGTYSNLAATPFDPSADALITARAAMRNIPGHSGVIDGGVEAETLVCTNDQVDVWEEVLGAEYKPENGNFARPNVVSRKKMNLKGPVALPLWQNTTTDWALITNKRSRGVRFLVREKEKTNTWRTQENMTLNMSCYARWAVGWTDPRGVYYNGTGD